MLDSCVSQLNYLIGDWAERGNVDEQSARNMVVQFLENHEALGPMLAEVQRSREAGKDGTGAIGESYRGLWDLLSNFGVVATNEGWQCRRTLLGAICGPNTTFAEAKSFVGGQLSDKAFKAAKDRRQDVDDTGCLHSL